MKSLINSSSTIKWLALIAISFFAVSCEEVIDIDLNSSAPRLVAEGYIEQDSVGWVRLSYTTDYFTTEASVYMNDASVSIYNEQGDSETLDFYGNGLYRGNSLVGTENLRYTMSIVSQDFSHEATSKLFSPVQNLSVNFEKGDNPRPGQSSNNFTISIWFDDDPAIENYYLIKFQINDTLKTDRYNCIKDSYYTEGGIIEYSPMRVNFKQNDDVVVYVYSIDEGTYTYYNQLNDLYGSGMNSSTPYNPQSNFGNEVLGYFLSTSCNSVHSVVQ